jgi:hypothetical protein
MFKKDLISMENDVSDKNDGNTKHISGIYNILGIIAHLDRIRNRTEADFPGARAFVRPGFDENFKDKKNEKPYDSNAIFSG